MNTRKKQRLILNPTIAAISTPSGESGLGIIRLSGSKALGIANIICRLRSNKKLTPRLTHTIHAGSIYQNQTLIDHVMVAFMKAPRTYTGEDIVEFTTHGSPVIMKAVLQLMLNNGAVLAEPGEFTKRAYLNGKMDLAQAEAVADVISAKTLAALHTAQDQLTGGLSRTIGGLKKRLINLIAQLEVRLDHPDEDIESVTARTCMRICEELTESIASLLETAFKGKIIKHGIRLAIIGKPNVGKSSLLNALIEHERSIVTDEPGTTRDTVDAVFQLNGIPLHIVDTAGIRGHAYSRAEHLGIQRSKQAAHEADILLAVFDSSSSISKDDQKIMDISRTKTTIGVLNKNDLTKNSRVKNYHKLLQKLPHQAISALTGQGIEILRGKYILS
ncbi:MAG: tRNA uridine-5-carboxymethylaminomethyl(34) synthesis GTPase MnmE [bacterium]